MATEQRQLTDVLMAAIAQSMANLHTATVARVTAVNAKTINCRPVISRIVNGESIELPEFLDVPVFTLQGGGSYTAYPVAVDDYAILIFTERCFDRWWNGQDYQPPLELRMHDYSDGIAFVGINPLAGAIPIPTKITTMGDSEQTGTQTIKGDLIVTGNITAQGEVTADSDGQNVSLSTHLHTGNLGAPTSPPTADT